MTEDDRDQLRDAIKYLEKAIDASDVLPSTRFMLAVSYAYIGDGHNAARHYQWMVDSQQRFLAACAQEEGALWGPEVTDEAASLDHLGTYEQMARLYQKRGDYQAAAEWFRKEADRNRSLDEDPNISIILALGSIGTTARKDDTRGRPELLTREDEDSKPFVGYLTGGPKFTLGEMLRTLPTPHHDERCGNHEQKVSSSDQPSASEIII